MVDRIPGFKLVRLGKGLAYVSDTVDGRWTVLAGYPPVKFDNRHRDRRPHMHPYGWDDPERWYLRDDLTVQDVLAALKEHLATRDFMDVATVRGVLA